MEQQAKVIRIVDEYTAMIAVKRKSACSGDCHTCHGCPHPDEIVVVPAANLAGAKKGDDVIVTSSTGRVLKLALLLYIMPVALFFLGYFLAGGGETRRTIVGVAAFLAGIGICVLVSRRMKQTKNEMQFEISDIME